MFKSFLRNRRGGVAIMFGLALVPLVAVAGVAVDYGRLANSRSDVQKLLDSAAIVAVSGKSSFERETLAQDFVMARKGELAPDLVLDVVPESIDGGEDEAPHIRLTATGSMPTAFVRLLGIEDMPFTIVAEAAASYKHYEVVLVVDVTGSMKGTRISALRDSAETFVETLLPDDDVENRVRIAIVPYSAAVNIGRANADWLAPAPGGLSAIVQNRYVFTAAEVSKSNCSGTNVSFDDDLQLCHIGDLKAWDEPGPCPGVEVGGTCYVADGWGGCIMERFDTPHELTADTPATAPFPPFYWPSWNGLGGGSDAYNSYLPSSIDESWNTNATSNNGRGPNLGCPKNPITAFSNDRPMLLGEIEKFEAWHRGGTMGHIGMLWGWRMLSPTWRGVWDSSSFPRDFDPQLTEKIVVFMTDGANGFYTGHAPAGDSDYTAYGRVSDSATFSNGASRDELDARMKTVCSAMKDLDIEIFTVGFDLSSTSAHALLGECASSPSHNFAADTTTLEAHFETIARDIAERGVALTR